MSEVKGELKGASELPPAGIARKLSLDFKTGDWRALRPVLDDEKCTRCMICRYYCPEEAIHYDKDNDRLRIDYDYCKGCGICANECPVKAIQMVPER